MWETVGNKHYYYHYRYADGRAYRIYVGSSLAAELQAALDAQHRAYRRAQLTAQQAEQANWNAVQAPLLDLHDHTDLLMKAALYAAGCYQHYRHWRRRHGCPS